jgi:hypothetical protein
MYVLSLTALLCVSLTGASHQVVQSLYEQAHEYANLANRAVPVAADLLVACNDRGIKSKDMHSVAKSAGRSFRLFTYESQLIEPTSQAWCNPR